MNRISDFLDHWLAQQRVHPNADERLTPPEEVTTLGSHSGLLLINPAHCDEAGPSRTNCRPVSTASDLVEIDR